VKKLLIILVVAAVIGLFFLIPEKVSTNLLMALSTIPTFLLVVIYITFIIIAKLNTKPTFEDAKEGYFASMFGVTKTYFYSEVTTVVLYFLNTKDFRIIIYMLFHHALGIVILFLKRRSSKAVEKSIHPSTQGELASVSQRASAHFIDAILFLLIPLLFVNIVDLNLTITAPDPQTMAKVADSYQTISTVIGCILYILYEMCFLMGKHQATPGKRFMNIYVVSGEESSKLSLKNAFIRALLKWILILLNVIGIIIWYITIKFSKNRQAPHDMTSKSRVLVRNTVEKADDWKVWEYFMSISAAACILWMFVTITLTIVQRPDFSFITIERSSDNNSKLMQAALAGDKCRKLYDAKQWQKAFSACKIASRKGERNAQFEIGRMYFKGNGVAQSYEEAIKWFSKAAEQGDSNAQGILGAMYLEGIGMPKDFAKAFKWFFKAAEQGDVKSQTNLGVLYAEGAGVAKDNKEAIKWFSKAAERGHAPTQFTLGNMYYNGEGTAKDMGKAFQWHSRAAEQGYADSQFMVGAMYQGGMGISKDYVKSYAWLSIVSREHPEHIKLLNEMAPYMTKEQIAEAKKIAAQFKPVKEVQK